MILSFLWYSCTGKVSEEKKSENKKEETSQTDTKIIQLNSSDTELNEAFSWATKTAMSYVNLGDPVGPWYEAALPERESFCMRDVAHMSIGAYYLGLRKHNKNMLTKFVENISASRDYCSYWEINKNNDPTPVDYTSDDDFWYNLPANFDVMFACYQLYKLTGDEDYLIKDSFYTFHSQSTNQYVDKWDSDGDGIMNSPVDRKVHRRGIGSYEEQIQGIKIGADLVAAQAKGYEVFSEILRLQNKEDLSIKYSELNANLKNHFSDYWWNDNHNIFYGYQLEDGSFSQKSNGAFILYFGLVDDKSKINATLTQIEKTNKNVESKSYFPMLFYTYGKHEKAFEYLIKMADPSEPRRSYPEVSYSFIGSVAEGLMGVKIDAPKNTIETNPKLPQKLEWIELNNIPFLNGHVNIKHTGSESTMLVSTVKKPFTWRAYFSGDEYTLWVNKKKVDTQPSTDFNGNPLVFTDIVVQPGKAYKVSKIKDKSDGTYEN